MRNSSARFISRFKFVIGAAVVAVAAVATTVALLSNPVPLNSQAAAGVAQFNPSTDLTVAEGTAGTFNIEIGARTAQSRLSLSIESGNTAAITGTQKDVTIQVGSTSVTTFPYTIVVESSTVSTELQISVSATDDSFYEGNEEFTFKLETVMNGNITIGTAASRKLIVGDNDNAAYAITFQSGQSELRENSNVGLNVAITNGDSDGVAADHTVPLPAAADGVALPSVTIMAGSNSANFTVSHANDNFWTGNYNATIRTTSGGGSLMVPVIDNDRPVVRIIAADGSDPITVTEGETNTDNLTLEVLVLPPSGVLSGDTTFKLRRSTMSTTGSPSDMIADVTVPAGMASADFSFNAGADSAFDPGIYVLEVHEAESLGKTVTPFESAVNIVIVDRNPLSITFTVDKPSVAEDDMDKTVTFRASIAPLPSLSYDLVLVVTPALTRVSADDVDMIPNELTIMQGQDTTMPYTITVTDDDEVEIDELFELEITELRYRDGFSRNADGSPIASTGFTITSDDTASWSLSAANTTLAEGTSIAVTITSDKPLPTLADPPDLRLVVTDRLGASVISAAIPRTSQLYSGMTTDVINIPNPHDDLFELDQEYTVRLAGGITIVSSTRPLLEPAGTLAYTITDDPNEMPDITLDYGGDTTVNEGGMITARITVANAPDTGLGDGLYVQFAFNTMGSTASAGDISFPLVGILIPMGQRSANIVIQAMNNDMFDPGEVFALSVNNVWYGHSNRVSGTEVTPGTVDAGGTIRIVNTTDAPAATLTRVGDEDVEEAAVEKIFTITLNEAIPTTDLILSVDFGGTATRNTDYSAPDTVTIPAGQTSVNYTVTVITDADAEFDETVMLSISGGTTGDGDMFSLASPQNAEFTITNDDIVTVTLTGPASAISESTATQIDITLSIPLPPDVLNRSYIWETLSGSNFEDISSLDGVEPFPDCGSCANDAHSQSLGFDFEFYGQTYNTVAVQANGFVGFTTDPADIQGGVSSTSSQVIGGATPGNVPIVAPYVDDLDPRPVDSDFYATTLGTAGTPDHRFIAQYSNYRVVTGEIRVTFQVVLYAEDGRIEFRYQTVPNQGATAKVGISDGRNPNPDYIEVSRRERVLNPDTRIVFTPIRLDVVTKDDEGQQVGRLELLTALMAGDRMRTISVPADLGNTDWEADRAFTAEARVANLPFVTLGSPVTYTVEDDDTPVVVLERADGSSDPISITEGGSIELRARLTNVPDGVGAPEDLEVNLIADPIADPASTAILSEYSFPASVTIDKGDTEMRFTVMTNDDDLVEFAEGLTIAVATLGYGGGTPPPSSSVNIPITIKSDDPIVATITFPDGSRVTEGGMVTARITLNKLLPARTPDSALSLVLKDGTLSNADVTIVSKDITDDLKTSRSTDVTIQLTDDMLLEGDETVEVMLQIDSTKMPDLAILVPDLPSASFTITDNEVGMVEIAQVGNTSPEEGDTVQFEFTLDLADGVTTDIPVMVEFDITAPPGVTYEIPSQPGVVTVSAPGLGTGFAQGLALPVRGLAQMARSYMITIPAMMTRAVLTVQLTDDTADPTAEETEELAVSLESVSTSSAEPLIQRNPSKMRAEVPVLDNEDPDFEIIGDGEVNEDDGTYPVRLRRLGRISDNEIAFELAGDGADDGDFVGPLTGRKFVFSGNNALSDPILLTLDDDNSEESEKTFKFVVITPGTGARFEPQIFTSVDPNNRMSFTSITLLDSDVSAFSGLPATGGPVLPVWLLLALALTGVALLIPAFKLNR